MRSITRVLLPVVLLSLFVVPQAKAQGGADRDLPSWNIKTNLLYDATGTINLGVEFRLSDRLSLDIPVNYNGWDMKKDINRKWRHVLVQPELRWWLSETFRGHFFGLHAHYAFYNIGNLPKPFSQYMQTHRFEGWMAGAGVSWGYRWNFTHWLGMEATVGVGYMYKDYERCGGGICGDLLGEQTKHYFGPTKVGLSLIFGIGGAKQKPYVPEEKPVYTPVYVAPVVPAYTPNLSTSYVVPEVESPKVRSQSYTAYIDFEQGRWEIIPSLRNNSAELRRINDMTRRVAEDDNASITGISITGYASPEDTYERNQVLSERRTQAVRDYVNGGYNLHNAIFSVRGAGEDWATLDSLVAASAMSDKYRVLEIIRGYGDPDAKENRLKELSGGATYRRIFDEFYPKLRRTDYRVDYTVVPFTVEEGKKVLSTQPGNLSLNEMYMIAGTLEPGGKAFNEVFETAVRVFPASDVANINAAAAALERRDTGAAAGYLARVREHTPAYWNNLGVLAWLQGDKAKAAECFARAGIQAAGNASEVDRHFRSIK